MNSDQFVEMQHRVRQYEDLSKRYQQYADAERILRHSPLNTLILTCDDKSVYLNAEDRHAVADMLVKRYQQKQQQLGQQMKDT